MLVNNNDVGTRSPNELPINIAICFLENLCIINWTFHHLALASQRLTAFNRFEHECLTFYDGKLLPSEMSEA